MTISETLDINETVKRTKAIIETFYNLDISKQTRLAPYVEARAMFYKLLREECCMSLVDCGRIFNQNHATVIHAVKTINGRIQFEKPLQSKWDAILSIFKEDYDGQKEYEVKHYHLLLEYKKVSRMYKSLLQSYSDIARENYELKYGGKRK